jgi:DNA-binding MarR family transcriptional regulator
MDATRRIRRQQARRELIRSEVTPFRRSRSLIETARFFVEILNERSRFLPGAVFEDPQWLMTLELFIAIEERRSVSVTSLCAASGVPPTTALRHIRALEANGIFQRVSHPSDRRISHIRLADSARSQVARYLAAIGSRGLFQDDEPPLRTAH